MDAIENSTNPRSKRAKLVIIVLLIAATYGGYMLYNSTSMRKVQVNDNLAVLDVRLENLDKSIARHEERLAALEKAQPTAATPAAAKDDERIVALEKEIAALKSVAATPKASGASSEETFDAIRLLSAFNRFSSKVIGGRPFAAELSALEELDGEIANSKPVTALAPFADNGIPTFATLLASFDESLDQLNIQEATPPAGAGLWDRFIFNLKHLVNIRKTSDIGSDNSVDAIVSRAQLHLEREEFEATVTELKLLPENVRSNFTAWIEDAQISSQTPALLDAVEEQVMQKAFHAEAPTTPSKKE